MHNQDTKDSLTKTPPDTDHISKACTSDEGIHSEKSISQDPISAGISKANTPTCGNSDKVTSKNESKVSHKTPSNCQKAAQLQKISDSQPSLAQQRKFREMELAILEEFHDVISDHLTPDKRVLGKPVEITFKKGIEIKPIHITIARPVPIHLKAEADKTLDKYLREGVLVPVSHPTEWLSPGMWVPKGDKKSVRLVTDFSHINKFIQRNVTPFASASDCIQMIPAGTRVFCSCDCLSGYFQIPLSEKASYLTTFLLPNGKFRYLSAPMGLSNSSDEFLSASDKAIAHLDFCIKLVDDILVYAKDEDELMDRVRQLMLALRAANITLSKKKLKISSSVKFAGSLISQAGVAPDPSRIQALVGLTPPENVKEARGWLGAVGQLNIYHPHLAWFLKPIQALTKKDTKWNWSTECDRNYQEVKKLLLEHLNLKFYDPKKPSILMTDASFFGVGFCLVQTAKRDEKGTPIKFDLIKAGSRTLRDVESRYSVSEVEATALHWGLKKCDHYLRGAPDVEAWSDHKPLCGMKEKPLFSLTSRLCRIFEKMAGYDFKLKYVKGASHYLPDYLSRKPFSSPTTEDTTFCKAVDSGTPDAGEDVVHDKTFEHLLHLCRKDKDYSQVYKKLLYRDIPDTTDTLEVQSFLPVWSDLSISGDLILLGQKIVIPFAARRWILTALHKGHQGLDRTLALARVRYFWPSMSKDIKTLCKTCTDCIRYLPSQQKEPLKQTLAKRPFEQLSTDVFTCMGKKFLICVDRFSTFPFVIALQNETASHVVSKFEELFLNMNFSPVSIRSDSGKCYVAKEFQEFLGRWGIVHEPSSPHFKQCNGQAEASVKKCKKLLEIHSGVFSSKFRSALNILRSTPTVFLSTADGQEGPSPTQLLYGQQTRIPELPSLDSVHEPIDWREVSEYKKATARIRQQYYDQNARSLRQLPVGTQVVIQDPISRRWCRFGSIKQTKKSTRSYIVECENGTLLERNRRFLRPLYDPDS